jgi:hypothetical protein
VLSASVSAFIALLGDLITTPSFTLVVSQTYPPSTYDRVLEAFQAIIIFSIFNESSAVDIGSIYYLTGTHTAVSREPVSV